MLLLRRFTVDFLFDRRILMIPTPDTTPATGDPGDDIARRYRYQWTYAAIACCLLLDDTQDAAEVFCEQQEDVLVKHTAGLFSGLQIKTRASNQNLWKANDEALIAAFARFAHLEATFPGQFKAFRFLTNHPLYAAGNGRDICHLLERVKAAMDRSGIGDRVVERFLARIAKEAGCTEDVAFTALSKSIASDELPKLPDIHSRLLDTLTQVWTRAGECSHATVSKAASELVRDCENASSLAHEGLLPAYLPLVMDDLELVARINAKRFDKARVLAALDRGASQTAQLDGDPESCTIPGVGSPALLEAKLDAGGFSAVSLNSAKDLRDKADYLGLVWTKKLGREQGLQRYGHIRSMVLRDAADAYESTKRAGEPFGVAMLTDLRTRFQFRRRNGGLPLHECSDEHLAGVAYSLTSECQIVWSIDRPWEPRQ